MRNEQLADILRPKSFDDIVGQEHLFGERGVVRRMVDSGRVTNMIFFEGRAQKPVRKCEKGPHTN